MKEKKRLDVLVLERHPHLTRNQVQSFIMQGLVFVDGKIADKSGKLIDVTCEITLTIDQPKFVSRAGVKLEAALENFKIDVKDFVVLDAGISTGGFTDCLLQRGAKKVYGVDVGKGQVHEKVQADQRLVLLEETNLRYLEKLPELVDLITLDLSFISVLKVMPAVSKLLKQAGKIIILIKPQFEADRKDIGSGGLVKGDAVHEKVIKKVQMGMLEFGFKMVGVIDSPITGAASGNKEFLALFEKTSV
ncbi:MAG: TlyA family RNA methyltransferase [bacterium]